MLTKSELGRAIERRVSEERKDALDAIVGGYCQTYQDYAVSVATIATMDRLLKVIADVEDKMFNDKPEEN